jgi:4-hydroxythreonine-4-phosphate dehydrogenase
VTEQADKRPLAITCGDPAGIGPEVIAAALQADALQGSDCVFIGPESQGRRLSETTGAAYESVGAASFRPEPGQPTPEGAALALAAMEAAAEGCLEGRFSGVVTGPISKLGLQEVGFTFPGQTEFFAHAWKADPSMAFVGRSLRVVLATWHLPLRAVPQALDAACLEKAVRRAYALAARLGVASPRIAVCGLNPHAGEGGLLGTEEAEIMDPLLDQLRTELPGLSRCLPGDTVFHRQRQGEFDVVVAAYHDQALAALKTLEFDSAVNLTLGLPYVRTSPDHGTAFPIAGQGIADPGSFAAALQLVRRLA